MKMEEKKVKVILNDYPTFASDDNFGYDFVPVLLYEKKDGQKYIEYGYGCGRCQRALRLPITLKYPEEEATTTVKDLRNNLREYFKQEFNETGIAERLERYETDETYRKLKNEQAKWRDHMLLNEYPDPEDSDKFADLEGESQR
jgi:hypothetical protein